MNLLVPFFTYRVAEGSPPSKHFPIPTGTVSWQLAPDLQNVWQTGPVCVSIFAGAVTGISNRQVSFQMWGFRLWVHLEIAFVEVKHYILENTQLFNFSGNWNKIWSSTLSIFASSTSCVDSASTHSTSIITGSWKFW